MKVFTLFILLFWTLPALADTATVVEGTRVNLRSGKYDTYRVVKALEPGTQLEVLKQESSYVQVKTAEGDMGWLPLRLLKITVAPPPSPAPAPKLEEVKAEIAKAQAELKQNRNTEAVSTPLLLAAGFAGLVLGVLLGVAGLEAYYRKKLNGLRI